MGQKETVTVRNATFEVKRTAGGDIDVDDSRIYVGLVGEDGRPVAVVNFTDHPEFDDDGGRLDRIALRSEALPFFTPGARFDIRRRDGEIAALVLSPPPPPAKDE